MKAALLGSSSRASSLVPAREIIIWRERERREGGRKEGGARKEEKGRKKEGDGGRRVCTTPQASDHCHGLHTVVIAVSTALFHRAVLTAMTTVCNP